MFACHDTANDMAMFDMDAFDVLFGAMMLIVLVLVGSCGVARIDMDTITIMLGMLLFGAGALVFYLGIALSQRPRKRNKRKTRSKKRQKRTNKTSQKVVEITPLHAAVMSQDLQAVRRLLNDGADPFEKDGEGLNAVALARMMDVDQSIRDAIRQAQATKIRKGER